MGIGRLAGVVVCIRPAKKPPRYPWHRTPCPQLAALASCHLGIERLSEQAVGITNDVSLTGSGGRCRRCKRTGLRGAVSTNDSFFEDRCSF